MSWVADRWWHFGSWFFNWWHPPSDDAYPNYGYYGRSRSNRLSRAWRRLRHRIRRAWPGKLLSAMLWRLHDWWYPPSKDPYPGYGYYGHVKRSRFAIARRHLRHRIRDSAFGRRCGELYERLYEWWYPVLDDPYPYYGYYGRKRKSRPVVVWRRFKRRVRDSWLGRRYREFLDRFYEWWYPPFQASEGHYPHYHNQRVSRPVLAFRRWNRWFRKTWIGREFGWILDEVTFLLEFVQLEVADVFSWQRVQKFLSKKQNIAVLVVLVLAAAAGYKYGRPHYRRYVEQQYARQAEQFMLKGDFARAYLRARQVTAINPDNAVACRVNAELADWANSPFALYWRQRTVLLAPTATNRLAHGFDGAEGRAIPLFDRGENAR
jgi:hypothetical protein